MRSFLGIEIPGKLKKQCVEIQEEIENTGTNAKMVEKNNLHWTVKFLGEIKGEEVNILKKTMEETVKNTKPIKINAEGLGVFPNLNYIKTIWLGVSKNKDKFTELLKKVNKKLEENGFKKEKHGPKPHLTLARVKSGKNKEKLKNLLHNMEDVNIGKMTINEINLYKSTLKPKGPTYNKITNFHFGE